MRLLVRYILTGSDGEYYGSRRHEELTIEQEKLQQLCLYQLVLGCASARGGVDEGGEQPIGS